MKTHLNRSFKVRIKLDDTFSRSTTNTKKHWVGSTFKSFSVIGASHKVFHLDLAPEPNNSKIGSIPLRLGYYQNFKTEVGDACFENSVAQPGRWVDVLFFVEDEMSSNPAIVENEESTVELGFARGVLDGFTRQVFFSWIYNVGMLAAYDVESPIYNDGELDINGGGPFAAFFKVPAGYEAHVIGCETTVNDLPVTVGTFYLTLFALEDGTVYTGDAPVNSNRIGYIFDEIPSGLGEYNNRILNRTVSGDKGYDREGIIFDENEVVCIAAIGSDPITDGQIDGFLLLRLKRKEA